MEGLSVDGLQRYHTLFIDCAPRVSALLDEVSTAIKAQQLAVNATIPVKSEPQAQQQRRPEKRAQKQDPVLGLIQGTTVSFAHLVNAANLTADELQKHLLELEKQRQIKITISKGG
jgi:predicted Rossmann fold nucleotide-binding protein DprA/Smf involved in DNA uptake